MTLPQRHDGARLPIDLPDDDEPVVPFRHWVEADYPPDDDPTGQHFFRGALNVLAFVTVIAALIGLYVVTP